MPLFQRVLCLGMLQTLVLSTVNHYEGDGFFVVHTDGDDPSMFTWTEGRAYCRSEFGTDYFAINSAEKQTNVQSTASSNGVNYKTWAGFTDSNDFSTGEC